MGSVPILVLNSGSSSLKFGLFVPDEDGGESILLEATANGIGHSGGTLVLKDAQGKEIHTEQLTFATPGDALAEGLKRIAAQHLPTPAAIGHRIVHGGPHLVQHQLITPAVLQTLRDSVHFAPLHIPASLQLVEAAQHAYPALPQYACFDTVFHATLPEAASHLPLPQRLWDEGVRRYGFHGLSYESIVHVLEPSVPARLIVAHLGSGCSVAAIAQGRSVDTSMGLTPTGGVVMATRTGDLDPGVLLYLMRTEPLTADTLETLLNHDCGLTALGGSSDIRDLEKSAAAGDTHAQLALDIFYRTIAKAIAGYVSVLGGLDTLVFTGGIGEHSDRTRRAICTRLAFLGITLSESSSGILSSPESKVGVRALPSEEELQIARHCRSLMTKPEVLSTTRGS